MVVTEPYCDMILRIACEYFHITKEELVSATYNDRMSHARRVIFKTLKDRTGNKVADISRAIGAPYHTVRGHIVDGNKLLSNDRLFTNSYNHIKELIDKQKREN